MESYNPQDFKNLAISAAEQAGDVLMRHYGNVVTEFKEGGFDMVSIVTKADRESEDCIAGAIRKHFPAHGIYGEEGTDEKSGAEYIWYIDPLDGTSNFTRNIPLFGISIGLIKNGRPIVGVLHFPALKLLLSAEDGKGAFANGTKIKVSTRSLEQSLYYSGGKYKSDFLNQLQPDIASAVGLIKIIDASSYEFAQIAMGDAEIYFLKNVPYDVVAGICVVREAGGVVSDAEGNEWQLSSKEILATTPSLHPKILSLLRGRESTNS